ncbi:hypothetical protein D3C81_1134550 [compost metagenome]
MVAIDVAAIAGVAIGRELEDHAICIRVRQAAHGTGSIARDIEDIHDRYARLVTHGRHAGAQIAPSHEAEGDEAGARQGQIDGAGERVASCGRGGADRVALCFRNGAHGGAAIEHVAECVRVAACELQGGTGAGRVVILRQAAAAAARTHLQHVGVGGRPRIDGARIDGDAAFEEGAVAGIAVGAGQRQRAGAGGDAEIVQLIDGQAVRTGLRLTAGQQACRRQCAQPTHGLVSCVIDVHRSLLS